MAHQYFENNESLAHNYEQITYYFKGHEIVFTADAGVFSKKAIDFGSSLLLKTLELNGVKSLLDVGCGYGTMGITIGVMHPEIKITMVDVNNRALDLCRKNTLSNNVENTSIFESDAYENVDGVFDCVISNPPIRAGKAVVHKIILGAYDHLVEGGHMWCVIQKKQGAASAIKALKTVYKAVETKAIDKGYCIICATK